MTQLSVGAPTVRSWGHPQGDGCRACADNVNVHSPPHDRNPKHCRWYDKGISTRDVQATRRTTARLNLVTYLRLASASLPNRGSCPTTTDRDLLLLPTRQHHHLRRQPHFARLRAPRLGSSAGPTAGASSHDVTVRGRAAAPAAGQPAS
eukprot:5625832-Pyramimonas_sp.AAC.1